MTAPSFSITRIDPSRSAGCVDVHVTYDGGGMVLTFPEAYPKGTLLAQVRLEVKNRLRGEDAQARLAGLLGRHDL